MKYFSALMMLMSMLAIGSGCCTHTGVNTKSPEEFINFELIKHIEESTVAMVAGKRGDRELYCGGIWIDEKRILTAAHCVENVGRALFDVSPWESYNPIGDIVLFVNHTDLNKGEIPQDKEWIGTVSKFDKQRDLALIQVVSDTSHHEVAKIISEPVTTGQSLHIMGHTIGMNWSYTRGYVANTRLINGPDTVIVKAIQASAPVWMGNSGGGAFDSEGHLIGLCSSVSTRAPNIAFFIHLDEIQEFIK